MFITDLLLILFTGVLANIDVRFGQNLLIQVLRLSCEFMVWSTTQTLVKSGDGWSSPILFWFSYHGATDHMNEKSPERGYSVNEK